MRISLFFSLKVIESQSQSNWAALSAPGANSVLNTTLTYENSGNQDYHLTSDDAVIAVGTDLSGDANLSFTTDIDGETRSAWNVGADEWFAPAGGSNAGIFFLRRR